MPSLKQISLNQSSLTTGKLAFITFLALVFCIPLLWVHSTIHERGDFYKKAQKEIAKGWASQQTITGPFIVVPFVDKLVTKNNDKIQYQFFSPNTLNINVQLVPQIRKRGIFQVIVYQALMKLEGNFSALQTKTEHTKIFFWEKAKIICSVSDMRGIFNDASFVINGSSFLIHPEGDIEIFKKQQSFGSNLNSPNTKNFHENPLKFSLELNLKGTEQFNLFPAAKETTVKIASSAKDPSFIGNFLPLKHHIHSNGFEANWSIPFLARSVPESFESQQGKALFRSDSHIFGVKLMSAVDQYKQAERATKYGTLFILYAFFIYFLFEVVHKTKIHIFQYTITACSLLCFFILLTAFSEHLGFEIAYCISAFLVMSQIYLYATKFIVRRIEKLSLLVGFFILYIYLFTILRLEDYAFMFGAIGLFVAISLGMYYTRNVAWFEQENT